MSRSVVVESRHERQFIEGLPSTLGQQSSDRVRVKHPSRRRGGEWIAMQQTMTLRSRHEFVQASSKVNSGALTMRLRLTDKVLATSG